MTVNLNMDVIRVLPFKRVVGVTAHFAVDRIKKMTCCFGQYVSKKLNLFSEN